MTRERLRPALGPGRSWFRGRGQAGRPGL